MKTTHRAILSRVMAGLLAVVLLLGLVGTLTIQSLAADDKGGPSGKTSGTIDHQTEIESTPTEKKETVEPDKPVYIEFTDVDGTKVKMEVFRDMVDHWAKNEVMRWSYYKVLKGVSKADFEPNSPIMRRDFAVILDRILAFERISANAFSDVEGGMYYTDSILRCNANGVLEGANGYFRPHAPITREEAVVGLCRAFKIAPVGSGLSFTDSAQVSSWAYQYMATAQRLGIIKGNPAGQCEPKRVMTRAEIVKMVDNMVTVFYNNSGTYTNLVYKGNGLVAKGGTVLDLTSTTGNIYCGYGASSLSITDSEIGGTLFAFATKFKLDIAASDIRLIELYTRTATLTGAGNVDRVVVNSGTLDVDPKGIPEVTQLGPDTKLTCGKIVLGENTGTGYKNIKASDVQDKLLEVNGVMEGGPTVIWKNFKLSSSNEISFPGIEVKDSGDSNFDRMYLLYNRNEDIPTIDDYDKKVDITKSFESGTKTTKDFTYKLSGPDSAKTYTYRLYGVNESGKSGYSEIQRVRGYSYSISSNMEDIQYEYNDNGDVKKITKIFNVVVRGDNVPTVKRVVGIRSPYNNSSSTRYETNMTNAGKESGEDWQTYSYTMKVDYNMEKEDTAVDNYFGYRVEFADHNDSRFPTISSQESSSGINGLQTGTASISNDLGSSDIKWNIVVSGNYISSYDGLVTETGIVLLTKPAGTTQPEAVTSAEQWQNYVAYTGTGNLQTNFSVTATVPKESGKVYFYAMYIKTSAGKTLYGAVRGLNGPYDTVITAGPKVTYNPVSKQATITMTVDAYKNTLNISKSEVVQTTDRTGIPAWTEHYGTLEKFNAVYGASNKELTFYFQNIEPEHIYTTEVKLVTGVDTKMVSIDIDTRTPDPAADSTTGG